jgi:predicted transcriptional regulator
MDSLGISQMPLTRDHGEQQRMVHEVDLLQSLVSGRCTPEDPAAKVAKPLAGQVSPNDSLSRVQEIFDEDNVAVVVEHDKVIAIIGKIDVVRFLAARS